MQAREFLNTPEGLAEIIADTKDNIREIYKDIAQCQEAQTKGIQLYENDNLDVISDAREDIVSACLELIFAKYSAGADIADIKPDYIAALNEMSTVFKEKTPESFDDEDSEPFYSTDEYWEILQIVALGILLNVSDQEKEKILAIRDKVPTPDVLLDYLCSYFDKRAYGYEQSIGDKYNGLAKLIKEATPQNAASLMKTYLENEYFKDYKRQGFVTTHNSKFNAHIGYWSFESGVVMKILGEDDTILKEQQFYPYDMVHAQ